jgi:hypothetical protein
MKSKVKTSKPATATPRAKAKQLKAVQRLEGRVNALISRATVAVAKAADLVAKFRFSENSDKQRVSVTHKIAKVTPRQPRKVRSPIFRTVIP